MASIGYFLSCEQYGPRELVAQARAAERAGFERLWISDHFHPWNDEQDQVSWDTDPDAALERAHRLWANDALPGRLAQTLPRPWAFADAMSLVRPEQVAELIVCGDDVKAHVERVRQYLDAGGEEVYVQQVGADHEGFFRGWGEPVLPELR